MNAKTQISYTQEIYRKSIHLMSLSIPICNMFLSRDLMLSILLPITLLTIVIDLLSRRYDSVRNLLFSFFGQMLREHESKKKIGLNGASWVLFSACLCVAVFPRLATTAGFAVLIVSDICAALIGRRYGTIKFWGKSLEGSLAFFISAYAVIAIIAILTASPWTFGLVGMIAAVVGTIAEASSNVLKLNDNIAIPVSMGIVIWVGNIIVTAMSYPPFL